MLLEMVDWWSSVGRRGYACKQGYVLDCSSLDRNLVRCLKVFAFARGNLVGVLADMARLFGPAPVGKYSLQRLRSRALLALESFLKHDHLLASKSLVETALAPLRLPCFVTISSLQERSRSILSRLIEASTPLGPMMFRGLPDPTPIKEDKPEFRSSAAAPTPPPPPPVSTIRQGFASTLASM
ncbi:hypothetical protein As57867_017717, partial [Aphanomyces stellatus]